MALVTKKESGFIYQDDFSAGINSRWEVSPNIPSRLQYDGTKLNLKHGTTTLYLFLKELTNAKEFVLDLKNTYNPTTVQDVGGITAYVGSKDFVALDEYFDAATGTVEAYPWIRLIRDYNNYSAYWSDNGTEWNYIGSNSLNSDIPKVGFFLEGTSGEDLGIELARTFKSTKVKLDNLQGGTKVSLVNEAGEELASRVCREQDNKVVFDVGDLPVPINAKFVIDTGVDVLDSGRFYEIYGGDEYSFEVTPDLIFEKDGETYYLDNGIEEFVGYVTQDQLHSDARITVKNPLQGTFTDVRISLVQHGGTDHWTRLVDVAKDAPTPVWGNQVSFSTISSGTEQIMWARLQRETDLTKYTPSVYFGLKVSANYNPN
ncbi:hypothetical protein ACPA0F_18170 [Solibacillus silvestris]